MGANKEGIVMKYLGARWLVIHVVQADERIAEERRELSTGLRQLLGGTRRADYFGDIRPHLQIGVAVVVDAGSPLVAFAVFEDGLRHFELTQFPGERYQPRTASLHLRYVMHAVAQCKERVQRHQTLPFER